MAERLSERAKVLLRACAQHEPGIMDDGATYYRVGGYGNLPLRYDYRTLPLLQKRGFVRLPPA